ncbi:MAG: HNH endonuclease [Lachnospiraceae bacterium]|nr:HNH endonuclease [Lachnospiraceae bacterium]
MIWKKADGLCAHCGRAANAALQTVDHVIPQSLGGSDDLRNLMPLCYSCNAERADDDIEPMTFYGFAHQEDIDDFMTYHREWESGRRNCAGELFVNASEDVGDC